jgi:hypothetical protein
MTLPAFCLWLGRTPLSIGIQNSAWLIPTLQSVHITAVAVVISSGSMLGLRSLGLVGRDPSFADHARRFVPWIWGAVALLLVTGTLLTIAEPARELLNVVFQLKMLLLLAALVLLTILQAPLGRDAQHWERNAGRRLAGRAIAAAMLCLWIAIIFAGRWIAYTGMDGADG